MAKILREYNELNYDRQLVKESIANRVPIILKTILQRCDKPNQNKRIYGRPVLVREMNNYQKMIAEGRAARRIGSS